MELTGLLAEIEAVLTHPPPQPDIPGLTQEAWLATAIFARVVEHLTTARHALAA